MAEMSDGELVRTSDSNWLEKTAKKYKMRQTFQLQDDAGLGVNPAQQTISSMAISANVGVAKWVQVCGSFGVSGLGLYLVTLAFLDPEPTSKLGLLVGSGVLLTLSGGFGALYVLTGLKPKSVALKIDGTFMLSFE